MKLSTSLIKGFALSMLALGVSAAFDATSNENVVVYWGQASAGSQEDLSYYCESDDVDIVVLSFMTSFPGSNDIPTLNFASSCTDKFSNGLAKCSSIASGISSCQSNGKKVLLSLGGESGDYGFSSDSEAENFAGTLWNLFGEGNSDTRPFGDSIIDGFDFDIENGDSTGYAALAKKLREYFKSGSKDYYLSAAPQCVYPDKSVGDLLENADIDFAFVQFYNNYCNIDKQFNWDTWADYASNTSPNKNIKIYLGLPGSSSAAGSGYVDISTVKSTLSTIGSSSAFGGVMLWDASQSFTNKVDGQTYVAAVKNALDSQGGSSSNEQSSSTSSSLAQSSTETTSSSTEAISSTSSTEQTSETVQSSTSVVQSSTPVVQSSTPVVQSSTPVIQSSEPTQAASSSTSSTLSYQEVTSNTFSSGPSTLSSVLISSTPQQSSSTATYSLSNIIQPSSSTAAPSAPSASVPSTPNNCLSLSGVAKAQCLNQSYKSGQYNGEPTSCTNGAIACSANGDYAVCNWGTWETSGCASGTTCFAYTKGDTVLTGCNYESQKSQFMKRFFEHAHHDHN